MKHKIDPNFKKVEEMIKNLGENERNIKECIVCVRNLAALLENSEYSSVRTRMIVQKISQYSDHGIYLEVKEDKFQIYLFCCKFYTVFSLHCQFYEVNPTPKELFLRFNDKMTRLE